MRPVSSSRAFTLLELMLAIAIAVAVLVLAVPRVRGLSGGRRLQEKFDRFDEITRKAQLRAIKEQRPWTLAWDQRTISLHPDEATPEGDSEEESEPGVSFTFDESEAYLLKRPTALLPAKDTPAEWTFWRSGTCEPAIISYTGPDGTWTAQYNPLTGRGEIVEMVAK